MKLKKLHVHGLYRLWRELYSIHVRDFTCLQIFGGNAWGDKQMFEWTQQEINVHAYDQFFGRVGLGAMPHKICFACCSQFAVSRERIQQRSRYFWQQNLHYLQYNDIQASNLRPKNYMVGESAY